MYIPDKIFLFYIYVFLPWVVIRSIRKARQSGIKVAMTDKRQLGTLVLHGSLLLFALATAWSNGIALRYLPDDTGRAVIWAIAALLPSAVWLVYRSHTAVPTDAVLPPQVLAPHGHRRWLFWVVVSTSAGITEEIVWRGVGTALVTWYVSPVAAALITAVAFGVVHAYQGKRGMLVTGIFSLIAQALIWVTGALVPAMAVHAVHDVAAGYVLAKRFPEVQDAAARRAAL